MTEEEEFEFRLRLEREQTATPPVTPAPVKPPNLVEQALAKRGLSQPPAAIQEFAAVGGNPAEAVGKMAYGAGGAVTDIASQAGLPPSLSALAGTVANLGVEGTAGAVAGGATQPLMQKGARWLMQSAIKPDRAARDTGDAVKAVETMLTHKGSPVAPGISASERAMEGVETAALKLNEKIDDILKTSSGMVNTEDVAVKTLKDGLKRLTFRDDPIAEAKIVEESVNRFLSHPQVAGNPSITVETAHKLKKGIYEELRLAKKSVYGEGKGLQQTEVASLKDRAANLRETIAQAEPKVSPSLKEQSDLMRVLEVAGPQLAREGNKNIMGMGWLIGESNLKTLGWMLDRYPWFKSFLARVMNTGSATIPAAATIAVTRQQQTE